jgi:hypothetical protein
MAPPRATPTRATPVMATAEVRSGNCPMGIAPLLALDVEAGAVELALVADEAPADIKKISR